MRRWFGRSRRAARPADGTAPRPAPDDGAPDDADDGVDAADAEPFVCASCGRTDLPPGGDWDPPVCVECDEERNFAAIEEVELSENL